jgi:tetratricopeptide (TPR) repeat protein
MLAALAAAVLAAGALVAALPARAAWLEPDPSYREAQITLRLALRDTAGRANDPGALDSLGVALLRLGRQADAEKVFRCVLALAPHDMAAAAALGKLALFRDRPAEAESLLAVAGRDDPGVVYDLMCARLRRGEYAAAAELATAAGAEGRGALLARLAEDGPYAVSGDAAETQLLWTRVSPVPLVRVRLNGVPVLMALDTGTGDLLVSQMYARRCNVAPVGGQSLAFWDGTRVAVRGAVVKRLDLGGLRVERVPAGILPLHKWSLEVNPQAEEVAGVIGLNLLRRFTPTLDFARRRLELRRPGADPGAGRDAARVPFEIWGESELTVYGTLAGGRRMAMVVATGLPGAGVGAPEEVMDEIGVRPSNLSRLVKSAGAFVQGRPWYEVSVPSVVVGPLVRDRVRGWSGALDSGELWRHGVRRDAILAGEFFRGRRVTLDWERHELVVEEGE